jgi:hypothetical protein
MNKKLLIFTLLMLLLFVFPSIALGANLLVGSSGNEVLELQYKLKERKYFNVEPTGYFGQITKKAVMDFQYDEGITVDGIVGKQTRSKLYTEVNTTYDVSWRVVNKEFKDYAIITDIATGISFFVKRLGGSLHADVEPLTKEDTAKFKEIVGNWTWERRSVIVNLGGNKVYPASINCMPHGVKSIKDNGFSGHFCCHFYGSRTHTGRRWDLDHQNAIKMSGNFMSYGLHYYFTRNSAMLFASRGIRK